MRCFIIFGLIVSLSTVSCKDLHHSHHPRHPHHRESGPTRRYKDTKNKRGIGDYPFGLPFGGSSFHGLQSASPVAASLAHGYASLPGALGYGAGAPINLGQSPFSLPIQPGLSSFSNLGYGQPLTLGQNSGYSLPSSGISLANLLSGHTQDGSQQLSLGLFSSPDKNGPVTFSAQAPIQSAQTYTPMYATSSQLGSSSYNVPVVLGSSQGSNVQSYSLPSPSIGSPGLTISSLTSGNGVSYNSPSSAAIRDTSSHSVSGGYFISGANPHQSGSSGSYSLPASALSSSPSSSSYTIAAPSSGYMKFTPASSEGSSYSPSSGTLKLASMNYASPSGSSSNYATYFSPSSPSSSSSNYGSNASPSSAYTTSSSAASYASSPSYSSGGSSSSGQSGQLLTSYGTPAMPYSIPSTSYGTPSHGQTFSSASYSSQNPAPSMNYASTMSNYGSSSGSPYQVDSYKSSNSYPGQTMSYGTAVGNFDANSNFKSPSSNTATTLSNSIDTYSYDDGTDSSSSYSNLSPRYLRYPVGRPATAPTDENTDYTSGSGYDTISYSVPARK